MTDETKDVVQEAVDAALKAMEEREAARKAEQEAKEAEREEIRKEVMEELKGAGQVPNWKAAFATKEVSTFGDDEDARMDAFEYYLRTADGTYLNRLGLTANDADLPPLKAMQEGTVTEGGYMVPDDFYEQEIIERRDKLSFIRQLPARVVNTDSKVIDFVIEDADSGRFTLTNEEATYNDTDRAIGQVAVTVYKGTRRTLVSEELVADSRFNIRQHLAQQFARDEAKTENYYVAVGTGSSQPQGVFAGGTSDAFTSSGSAVVATAPIDLWGQLKSPYRPDAAWLSHGLTQIEIRKLRDSNNWIYGDMFMTIDAEGQERLMNRPYFTQDDIGRSSDNGDIVVVGDFNYYAFVERQGLVVTRNPYLYENTGQVGFFARKRFGGAVLQAEAFQIMKTAA